ncbi:MAG: hypothetical protein K2N05_04450 [Muribaculaceae bacterium]|nr:hypothetical protein [Muribaculaceae bacterium]
MNTNILRIIILLGALIPNLTPSAKHKMVEEGKTWWYTTFKADNNTLKAKRLIVGFKINNSQPDDKEWYPVIAVDSLKNDVITTPVCWLKEENEKVWVRINLNIHNTESADSSDEREFISTCLLWWYGNELPEEYTCYPGNSKLWNPSQRTEYLLYDFDYKIGDICQWPWSGYQLYWKDSDGMPISYIEGPMIISGIKEDSQESIFNGESTKIYSLIQPCENNWNGNMQIVEGIGSTGGYLESYVPALISWYGFFFAPQSLSYIPAISGEYLYVPNLRCVEELDGKIIYGKPLNADAEVNSISLKNTHIPSLLYDLHGRVVSNPQPGSVYIRGGKKFVAK